jgi:hypothetical protein
LFEETREALIEFRQALRRSENDSTSIFEMGHAANEAVNLPGYLHPVEADSRPFEDFIGKGCRDRPVEDQ